MSGRAKEQWELYRKSVLPKSAGRTQLIETRRAFYAGIESMQRIMFAVSDVADKSGDDAAETEIQMVEAELKQFAADVKAGKA